MRARVLSAAIDGLDAYVVDVEVDLQARLPGMATVGLPAVAVRESKERVRSAIANCGFEFPRRRITVNLAPAGSRKEGTALDLPIAVGILRAAGAIPGDRADRYLIVGELSLDGEVRPVRGVLAIAFAAAQAGLAGVVVPVGNAREAGLVDGIDVVPVVRLTQVVTWLRGEEPQPALPAIPSQDLPERDPTLPVVDLADVKGQAEARRGLEVAAAGDHNLLMVGAPGAGKSLISRCLPGILPALSRPEALEVSRIYSVAGLLHSDAGLLRTRPFRAPHHTLTPQALIGGGSQPRPGEVTLAHHGVLFLDELPEFPRTVLEVLRQPLEDGEVTIGRARATVRYPARFTLVATANPCPCGRLGDPDLPCGCMPQAVQRYQGRVSGPLLDRVDLQIHVSRVRYPELRGATPGEPSRSVRERVERAREVQNERFADRPPASRTNAGMSRREVERYCSLSPDAERLLRAAMERFYLSARGHDRVLKVARTIADLAEEADIGAPHLAEAIQLRTRVAESAAAAGVGT